MEPPATAALAATNPRPRSPEGPVLEAKRPPQERPWRLLDLRLEEWWPPIDESLQRVEWPRRLALTAGEAEASCSPSATGSEPTHEPLTLSSTPVRQECHWKTDRSRLTKKTAKTSAASDVAVVASLLGHRKRATFLRDVGSASTGRGSADELA